MSEQAASAQPAPQKSRPMIEVEGLQTSILASCMCCGASTFRSRPVRLCASSVLPVAASRHCFDASIHLEEAQQAASASMVKRLSRRGRRRVSRAHQPCRRRGARAGRHGVPAFNLFPHLSIHRQHHRGPGACAATVEGGGDAAGLELLDSGRNWLRRRQLPEELSGGQQSNAPRCPRAGDGPEGDDVRRSDQRARSRADRGGAGCHARSCGSWHDDAGRYA